MVMKRLGAYLLLLQAVVSGRAGVGPGEQDWDYIDVREGAHMFYWLYFTTATQEYSTRPLIIWLQGGPGASSTARGNFEEIGIVDVNLNERNSSWVHKLNVLFIDNPVGTGFSYVDDNRALTKTNKEISTDLVTFMEEFIKRYPEFRQVPLYIFSESYGGKMAAEFALDLHEAVSAGAVSVLLKGVVLGDPWISPVETVMSWPDFLLQAGMVDSIGYSLISKNAQLTKKYFEDGDFVSASKQWSETENVIMSVASGVDFYNILYKIHQRSTNDSTEGSVFYTEGFSDEERNDFMNGIVRKSLGDTIPKNIYWAAQGNDVFNTLISDFMKPATKIVERLLNETKILVSVLSGNLDLIVDTPGTLKWVENLKWKNANAWKKTVKTPFLVNNVVEGFYKKYDNFCFYWILRSGHMVPTDNPNAALWIMNDITHYEN